MKTREPDGPAITRTAMVYTRVNSHEQARGGVSLDAQLEACRRQAAANGWVIGAEYRDVLSGMRDDRPGYQRMLADLQSESVEWTPVSTNGKSGRATRGDLPGRDAWIAYGVMQF